MSDTLCIDDDMMRLTALSVVNDIVDDLLLVVIVLFREQDVLRAVRDTAPQGDISGISSHNLDDTAALMGG